MSEKYQDLKSATQAIQKILTPEQFASLAKIALNERVNIQDITTFGINNNLITEESMEDNGNSWQSYATLLITTMLTATDEDWRKIFYI